MYITCREGKMSFWNLRENEDEGGGEWEENTFT